ncbi:transaldolase [Mucilaginibacter sp.]|uniref:transaldolase n=1 Tax=Mucilaginibacter sp. TaxID=1882438 RepID=UPI00262B1D2B|nr:transaldolase [Mucilaginibacter sp.]MDB4924445.1 Transaldolase [Mucilaginibacter sp.]
MEMNKIKQIHEFGQSIWLDFLDRKLIRSGRLKRLIEEDGLRGMTSNPAIFEKAISGSTDYDEQIRELAEKYQNNEAIFYELAITDIREATDLFGPVFTGDRDGYVSLEVSPHLAHDTSRTIRQATELWRKVDRKNVMIKIPATAEGLPAIRRAICEGINVNITLLFGLDRYEAVTDAYLSGLEDRLADGHPIDQIASVASFFLSRIDVLVDQMLETKGHPELKGEVAIACAKQAYQIYKQVFSSERFKKLQEKGARPQHVLWASTGTKDPSFPDTKYVDALIGPETVNTVPLETLEAYRDHGHPESRLDQDPDLAAQTLARLKKIGINIDEVTAQLENEGIEKFNKPYDQLLQAIEEKKARSPLKSYAL